MRSGDDRNAAGAAKARAEVVHDGDDARRLNDSTETTNEVSEIRQGAVQASLAERTVFGSIRTVDACVRTGADVTRRRLVSSG